MSTLSQFGGGARTPKALINNTSTSGGLDQVYVDTGAQHAGLKVTVSGALTADVLTTVLSITGAGSISFLACKSVDITTRTHRFRLTLDGVVVYDATTTSSGSINGGIILAGAISGYQFTASLDSINFSSSLLLEYASSVTETAKTNFIYLYRTY